MNSLVSDKDILRDIYYAANKVAADQTKTDVQFRKLLMTSLSRALARVNGEEAKQHPFIVKFFDKLAMTYEALAPITNGNYSRNPAIIPILRNVAAKIHEISSQEPQEFFTAERPVPSRDFSALKALEKREPLNNGQRTGPHWDALNNLFAPKPR